MSDTTEAAVQRVRHESPNVDQACRILEGDLESGDQSTIIAFAEIFFSKAPRDFLAERTPEQLARIVIGAFEFLRSGRPDRVDVQVINPDHDEEGWYEPVTVIRSNVSERPFVVDTIREFLHARGLPIEHNIYPVINVERGEDGALLSVGPSVEGCSRESLVHCEVPRISDAELRAEIERGIRERLDDVVAATDDFHPMIDAVNDTVTELAERARDDDARKSELEEAQAFLRWLRDGAFVFLGYRAYEISGEGDDRAVRVDPDSGLGILRDPSSSQFVDPVRLVDLPSGIRELASGGPILIISKTNAESTVHRRARMDYIGVKKLCDGEIVGEHRFIGLFTSRAYSEPAESIPILREKLQRILASAGVQAGSHDYKEINTIFNSMPKEDLLLSSEEEIAADIQTILTSYNTDGVRVSLRPDPLARGSSVMVILPKDRFSGEVRRWIEELLVDRLDGEVLNYHLALGTGDQARLHFYMGPRNKKLLPVPITELEADLRELIRSWQDRIEDRLVEVRPPDEARRLARRYAEGFSAEYQAAVAPEPAVVDILELEAMAAEGREVSVLFSEPDGSPPTLQDDPTTELDLYLRGQRLVLSDFMPILESLGLRVVAVSPFEVNGGGVGSAAVYSFAVQDARGRPIDIAARGDLLGESVLAIRAGRTGRDALNGLVMEAGLHWREIDILRAYAGYAFQLQAVPSRTSIPSALLRHPEMAQLFIEWFHAKFDPERGDGREERSGPMQAMRARYLGSLGQVDALADDRALRRMGLLLAATLRTNYFRNGGRTPTRTSGGVPYISLKFDAPILAEIQRTRLCVEVYVRSSRMEGVHLRGASVARGGIRWSDRPDDFRTEILGLVKTQMVKNAVIVPGGSKGGYVLASLPDDPEERAAEGEAQYQTLQRGLLDITDNFDPDGKIVHPEGVIAWDEPDPYLVVAADKGTAKFSDVANRVAEEYDFWLHDAYASGGSNGYDHKVVGITARGAWECVKRHFRELGKNIQEEPFTVAGIGDMSGDVFGNGMLLSKEIRLVAAFDHRHIFIDPDPDPASSWTERKRLFDLGRSSWDDYNRELLSPGGCIVPRGSKEVDLSPEAIEALGLPGDARVIDGESLIRAILCAPVELLWNGGIGTYVKATTESHADAGDATNDAVRVDAPTLRCKVVGEGGNLGLTQAGRVEYAVRGGRLNTDALDNSGGVDLSDREVNLKILLSPAVRRGHLPMEERNALLEELTDDIADGVIRDNWSQSLAVSLDELRQAEALDDFRDLMVGLERAGRLVRADEGLPSLEVLVERSEAGEGLQRPELCVLLAYAKLQAKSEVVKSDLPDEPALESYLTQYFPDVAIRRAGDGALAEHRLRREIITSQLTNELVDLMGATFLHRVSRDTGRSQRDVVAAWLVASRLADHQEILGHVEAMGPKLQTTDAYRWLLGLGRVLERTTRWVLDHFDEEFHPQRLIEEYGEGVRQLQERFCEIVTGSDLELYNERVKALRDIGANEGLAARLITLRFLDQLLEILHISNDTGAPPTEAGTVFYRISDRLGIPWLRRQIEQAASDDRWEQRAASALAGDLTRAHHRISAYALQKSGKSEDVGEAASRVIEARQREMDRLRRLLEEIQAEDAMSLAGLSVAVREIAALADRSERA
ncbi:MAG: NAD-glutamate dehydrogenase [Longimicrobiales bacterium]|nr:NAD-glutamate dehydrogenase [Longimicrobiales bacterium]